MNQEAAAVYAIVNVPLCVGCGCCVSVCPQKAISMGDVAEIDPTSCNGCGQCEASCPTGAISLESR